jgi:hypothetical protein
MSEQGNKDLIRFLIFETSIYGAITTSLKSVVIHGRPMASSWGNDRAVLWDIGANRKWHFQNL